MGRCTYNEGISILNNYRDRIDDAIYVINKNYNDMDLQNSLIQTEINDVISRMINECESLRNYVNEIYLK